MGDFHLETERLIIRNWRDEDRDLFYLINSDDKVMEYFPFRRDRKASDEMLDTLQARISRDGYGFTALELKDGGEVIGFCGLSSEDFGDADQPLTEIGWRLAPEFWGMGYITEAARTLLEFGFQDLQLDEIVSFAVHNNHRSLAVMERLGMHHDPERDFDHVRVPETHPHLVRHHFYALSREEYLKKAAG